MCEVTVLPVCQCPILTPISYQVTGVTSVTDDEIDGGDLHRHQPGQPWITLLQILDYQHLSPTAHRHTRALQFGFLLGAQITNCVLCGSLCPWVSLNHTRLSSGVFPLPPSRPSAGRDSDRFTIQLLEEKTDLLLNSAKPLLDLNLHWHFLRQREGIIEKCTHSYCY